MNKKILFLVVGSALLVSTTTRAEYPVDAYVNDTYTPKFQNCDLVTIYSQSEVLFKCSQTSPPANLGIGTGTIEFDIWATYQGQNYLCIGAVSANGAQQDYWTMASCY